MYRLSNSQAILIGSVIISVGIYLGLSRQVSNNSAVQTADSQKLSAAKSPVQSLPPPDLKQLQEQVSQALNAKKSDLLKVCPVKSEGQPDQYVIDFAFNANGKQIGRGFSEKRNNRLRLASCLSRALPVLTIQPPGVNVKVNVHFSFP